MKKLTTLVLLTLSLNSFSQEVDSERVSSGIQTVGNGALIGIYGTLLGKDVMTDADKTAGLLAKQDNLDYLLTPQQGANQELVTKKGLDNFIKQVKSGDMVVIEYIPENLEHDIESIKKKVQADFINKQKATIAEYRLEEEKYKKMLESDDQATRITARNNVNRIRGVIAYGESRIEEFKNFKDKEMLAMIDIEISGATKKITFVTDGNVKAQMKEVENFINNAAKNKRSIISVAKNADLGKVAFRKMTGKVIAVGSSLELVLSTGKGLYDIQQGYAAADRNEEIDNINNSSENRREPTVVNNVFGDQ